MSANVTNITSDELVLQRQRAWETAQRLGRRMGRGAPVRRSFLMDPDKRGETPLGALMGSSGTKSGGRGGRTRLLLELTALWTASIDKSEPDKERGTYAELEGLSEKGKERFQRSYKAYREKWDERSGGDIFYTYGAARDWAELIGLPDAAGGGARNIRNAKKDLQNRGFFKPDTGTKRITLLKEDGSGDPYTPPSGHGDDGFFRVPETFWTEGLVCSLSGSGAAMLLVFLAVGGNEPGKPMGFHENVVRQTFGLSKNIRSAGINELLEQNVILQEWRAPDRSYANPGFPRAGSHSLGRPPIGSRFVGTY